MRNGTATVRRPASAVLFVLSFVLVVAAGPLLYVSRVIESEDAFVSVADRIVAHPEVRRAVAEEVAELSFDALAADEAIAAVLPDEARALAVPLTRIATTQITDAAFDLLDTRIAVEARDSALRELHSQVTADSDEVTIDLRAVFVRVARELGGPTLGAGAAKLVAGTDTGRFTIAEPGSTNSRVLAAVRAVPDVGEAVALLAGLTLVAAVAVAADRRRAMVRGGLVLAAGAIVSMFVITILLYGIVAGLGDASTVGIGVADIISSDFAQQQQGVVLNGVVLALVGLVLGQRPAAVALRRLPRDLWQRSPDTDETMAAIIGDNPPLARAVVWLAGLLVMLGWSEPTRRVVATVIAVTVIAQGVVWLFTSAGLTAVRWRDRFDITVPTDQPPTDSSSRVGGNLGALTVGTFLLWPAWSVGVVVGFFTVAVAIQAAVDLPGARRLARRPELAATEPATAAGRRRYTIAIAAVTVAVVVGVAMTLDSSEPAEATTGCNGHVELCDKRIDEIVFPGSHNAMSSTELGWDLALQSGDIIAQLDHGIRALLIDTHYWDDSGTVEGGEDTAAAVVIEAALAESTPQPGTWLCHGFCALGATNLEAALADIGLWLDANPREVLMIVVQDEISTADTLQAFEAGALAGIVHNHRPGTAWPTLAKLIADNERVLVYAENEGEPESWYQNVWDSAFTETPFTFALRSDFNCDPNRGDPDNPLLLINHWLTTGIPIQESAAAVNSRDSLLDRVEQCQAERGRLPTILATDFVQTGDLITVVDELNQVSP